jgi:hypothetical protein
MILVLAARDEVCRMWNTEKQASLRRDFLMDAEDLKRADENINKMMRAEATAKYLVEFADSDYKCNCGNTLKISRMSDHVSKFCKNQDPKVGQLIKEMFPTLARLKLI